MMSRFATLSLFLSLVCLHHDLSAQTGYDQTRLASPAPIVYPATYPQSYPVGGWHAGSPTGISTLPQRIPQPYATPSMSPPTAVGYAPMAVGYAPMAPGYAQGSAQAPLNSVYYLSPSHGYGPVTYGYGGPAYSGPPSHGLPALGPAPQSEGSVLSQPAPSLPRQQAPRQDQVVPYGGSGTAGGESYGAAAAGLDCATAGSAAGYGYGNARFGFGAVGCTSPWFIGFGGLVMSRDNENYYLFSYDSADESIQLTNARDANFDWAGGFEVNFGRMFNGGQHAIEAVYWGLFPSDGTTITTDGDVAGNLNGILNWDQLDYGVDPILLTPWTADEFTNNSTAHMVRRQNEIHNVEVNLLTFLSGGFGAAGGGYGMPVGRYGMNGGGYGAYGARGGACGRGGCGGGPSGCGGGQSGCGGGNCGRGASCGGGCGGCSACGGAAGGKGGGYAGRAASLAGLGHGGVGGGYGGYGGSRWSHDWLVGVRFFRFRDNLLFGAERAGGNGIFRDEDDEIYYNIDITNDLIGVQLGCSGAYAIGYRCALDYGLKFGVYGNQISHTSEIGGSQGVATINNGPNAGVDFYVSNSKNDVAFLGEANLGASWRFGNCWSARLGYRAVAVTGIAHPTNQIYHDLRGIQDVRWVDSNGSLILHGGYARAEYRF